MIEMRSTGRSARTAPNWYQGGELVVLGWHNVEGTWRYPSGPGSGLRSLVRQLKALRRTTSVVPLEVAVAALHAGRTLPRRAVALTFDDGYRDNLTRAMPVLRDLELPATFFLVPGFLDGYVDPWWERLAWAFTCATEERADFEGDVLDLACAGARRTGLYRVEACLKDRDDASRRNAVEDLVSALAPTGAYRADELFMNWDEAVVLHASGGSIGSHTMRHAILAREHADRQRADLRDSKARLESRLHTGVSALAYPNGQVGDYDDATKDAANAAGLSCAVTTWGLVNRATTDPYELRRRVLAPGDNAARIVAGLARGVWRARAGAGRNSR